MLIELVRATAEAGMDVGPQSGDEAGFGGLVAEVSARRRAAVRGGVLDDRAGHRGRRRQAPPAAHPQQKPLTPGRQLAANPRRGGPPARDSKLLWKFTLPLWTLLTYSGGWPGSLAAPVGQRPRSGLGRLAGPAITWQFPASW